MAVNRIPLVYPCNTLKNLFATLVQVVNCFISLLVIGYRQSAIVFVNILLGSPSDVSGGKAAKGVLFSVRCKGMSLIAML